MKRNVPAIRKGNSPAWCPERLIQARQLALLGKTNARMAEIMGVSIKTIEYWWRTKPEFRESLQNGRDMADAQTADSLFQVANGWEVEEEHLHINRITGEAKIIKIKKKYKPDAWAAAKWLALRQRELWTEIQRMESSHTNININKFDFSGLSNEELMLIKKIGLKQIIEHARDVNPN